VAVAVLNVAEQLLMMKVMMKDLPTTRMDVDDH
jgi:hypothetical protein